MCVTLGDASHTMLRRKAPNLYCVKFYTFLPTHSIVIINNQYHTIFSQTCTETNSIIGMYSTHRLRIGYAGLAPQACSNARIQILQFVLGHRSRTRINSVLSKMLPIIFGTIRNNPRYVSWPRQVSYIRVRIRIKQNIKHFRSFVKRLNRN